MFLDTRMRSLVLLFGVLALQGCTSFDPLDQRSETVNRNATDYANDAILLNVVRASLSEPISFVSFTGYTGTQGATASVGLPSFTLGPNVKNTYTFGANTVSRNNSNVVTMSAVDDPKSFAALAAPLNPAILATLVNQTDPDLRVLLFFLSVSEIREMQVDAKGNETGVVLRALFNNPSDPKWGEFVGVMASLLYEGLVARIDLNQFAAGGNFPPSQLCIDPFQRPPPFIQGPISERERQIVQAAQQSPALCQNPKAKWVQPQAAKSDNSASPSNPPPAGKGKSAAKPAVTTPPSHLVGYPLLDLKNKHYEIFMRSTYGIYNYIGALLNSKRDVDNLQTVDPSGSGGFVNIRRGNNNGNCFAEIEYRDVLYCVPDTATNTKNLFTVLHQLQNLQTAPSNTGTPLLTIPAS